jgi:hypothetical protein
MQEFGRPWLRPFGGTAVLPHRAWTAALGAPMTAHRMCRTLVFSVALLLSAASAWAEPLAVLAAARGAVEVASASGSRARATFGRSLERGDKVLVPAGGSATVLFNDGNVVELGEKSTLTIGGKAAAPKPKTAAMPAEVYASVSRFATDGSRETGLVAVSSLRAAPEAAPLLMAPRKTALLDPRPTFRWRPVETATRYRVAISGEAGPLWDREVAGDSLSYPADAEPLAAGADYVWELRAWREDTELRREETAVHMLAADEAKTVRSALARIGESAGADSPAGFYLSGSYLSGRGLYQDALARFQSLGRISPESPAPHEAMGNLYRAVGLMDLAAAEYQRALSLGRE